MKIPLFFDGYDLKAYDFRGGQSLSYLRERLRYGYRLMKGAQPRTGFYVAFTNLSKSLQMLGHDVVINDFAFARRHPDHPIGLSGYLPPLARFGLRNPALYGPGRVPDPDDLEVLQRQLNLRILTYPSTWPIQLNPVEIRRQFAPMFVGIDTDAWPDMSGNEKSIDILLYNKVRWHRKSARETDLVQPLRDLLKARGLTWRELNYGSHTPTQYRDLVSRSRALLFCTEHETQGLAYQEAMSANLPVFAWDQGELVDPSQRALTAGEVIPSSVPYFDERCGLQFQINNIEEQFDRFWRALPTYRPRDYVLETLSLRCGGERFMSLYTPLLDAGSAPASEVFTPAEANIAVTSEGV
ncbi:glycosyltransferase [Phaeobacter sp. C3_T13_0]|uniref:glycosyltransferase n=1 Tax=Phaeobacter cretensis TaxID=3342641 RepID=UPI0039BD8495